MVNQKVPGLNLTSAMNSPGVVKQAALSPIQTPICNMGMIIFTLQGCCKGDKVIYVKLFDAAATQVLCIYYIISLFKNNLKLKHPLIKIKDLKQKAKAGVYKCLPLQVRLYLPSKT